jgi:hypothetical protein
MLPDVMSSGRRRREKGRGAYEFDVGGEGVFLVFEAAGFDALIETRVEGLGVVGLELVPAYDVVERYARLRGHLK